MSSRYATETVLVKREVHEEIMWQARHLADLAGLTRALSKGDVVARAMQALRREQEASK